VDDRLTEVRGNRAASALEDCQPATDLTKRVVHGITDVEPEELTAVVVRIIVKRRTGDVRSDLLNGLFIDIRVEDEGNLIRGGVVVRIGLPLVPIAGSRLDEGINLRPSVAGKGEARSFEVGHVVVSGERTLDTEGSDKLAGGGVAQIGTEISVVAEQITARLRARDESENGRAVFLTEGIVPSSVTDQLNTQDIKEILSELAGRRRNRTTRVGDVQASTRGVGRGRSSGNLVNLTEILRAATIVEDGLGELGQLLNRLGNLGLNLEGSLEIVQADARGLISLSLEVPSPLGLTEVNSRGIRNATTRGTGIGITANRRSNRGPAIFKRARKDTLNGDFRQAGSHSEGELTNTDETTPRAVNRVTLVNVNGETIRFPLEQIVNCRASNSCHNS
jgi:hypothetical protein